MAWMLLTMYNSIEKNTDWLKWAESALEFLKTKCVDPADGRMFFHVAADGTPIRKRRYAYSESFAAIAFAAHARATGSRDSAREARHWFDIFTDNCFTPGKMVPQIHRGTSYDRSGHPHDYPEHSSGNAQVPGR